MEQEHIPCSTSLQTGRVRELVLVKSHCRLAGERVPPRCLLAQCPDTFEVLYKLYNNQEERDFLA